MSESMSKIVNKINKDNFLLNLFKKFKKEWLLVIIPALFIIIVMFIPILKLFKLAVFDTDGFTLKYLGQIFTQKIYLTVILITLITSILVTLLTLVLAYPVCYCLIKLKSKRIKGIIMALVLIPFWISLLARTFSWMIILQDKGIVNNFLISIGLINQPIHLMYNTIGVVIGMTHILFPYMFLNIYANMINIDIRLLQVSEIMGSRPYKTFWIIFFPLSIPGIFTGSLLVFVLAMGYFIIPSFLGGTKDMMVSTLIQNDIISTLNWPMASALALMLFILMLLILGVSLIIFKNNPMLKEGL
ncbi:ABC transporter permease [Clostridium tyrobutyricum]|uniref:ABC transporter permease n=1 Tax=Clostridium tyrobutyricum TaxID=1519 RepID=UPI0020CB4A87|nr:ABC transporter permease [Clostridium tyrobutyricum]